MRQTKYLFNCLIILDLKFCRMLWQANNSIDLRISSFYLFSVGRIFHDIDRSSNPDFSNTVASGIAIYTIGIYLSIVY